MAQKDSNSVLCIGIAVLDYVFQVDSIPTKPEKFRSSNMAVVGGGIAANAAVAIARQGGKAGLITRLGDDALGRSILEEIAAEGVDVSGAKCFEGHRSPLSCILVDKDGERMIVSYSDNTISEATDWLPTTMPAGYDCVLGDTRWEAGSTHMFKLAREGGLYAVLDADRKPAKPDIFHACSHAAISMQAAKDMTGLQKASDAANALRKIYGCWLAVTNGAEGVYWTHGDAIVHTPAFKVTVVDTLGAGDTWHGAFALGLAEGMDEAQAVRYASAVAAIKCTRFGGRSGVPNRKEVEQFLVEKS
jgi:sulfofructose kinase